MPARITDEQRERKYVEKGAGCWLWTGARTKAGYGLFTADYKNVYAHIWSYERHHGPVPDGHIVDHTCHDPKDCPGGNDCPHRACCNPEHLVAVQRRVNTSNERSARWTSTSKTQATAS